jgi:hypothetical protein
MRLFLPNPLLTRISKKAPVTRTLASTPDAASGAQGLAVFFFSGRTGQESA